MTPQLQQAIRLLQLSTLDLRQEIQQTLESNPMLELEEEEASTESEMLAETQAQSPEPVSIAATGNESEDAATSVDTDFEQPIPVEAVEPLLVDLGKRLPKEGQPTPDVIRRAFRDAIEELYRKFGGSARGLEMSLDSVDARPPGSTRSGRLAALAPMKSDHA